MMKRVARLPCKSCSSHMQAKMIRSFFGNRKDGSMVLSSVIGLLPNRRRMSSALLSAIARNFLAASEKLGVGDCCGDDCIHFVLALLREHG